MPISRAQQLDLRIKSPRNTPGSLKRLGSLLVHFDRFEEAIGVYNQINVAEMALGDWLRLAQSNIAGATAHHLDAAEHALHAALEAASNSPQKSTALCHMGIVETERGALDKARDLFLNALDLTPDHTLTMRKYACLEFDTGRVDELTTFCDSLLAKGYRHARLLASYAVCLVAKGQIEDGLAVQGRDQFLQKTTLSTPEGFPTPESFHEALAHDLINHPALKFENSRTASRDSWRVDDLLVGHQPVIEQLLAGISDKVIAYRQSVADQDVTGPAAYFADAAPSTARIRAWSVISKSTSHQGWHMHGSGWLSGVYYVAMPGALSHEAGHAGAIEFGWSDRLLGDDASERFGSEVILPKPGELLLFPSHLHHRTFPHHLNDDRICIAFDIVPC